MTLLLWPCTTLAATYAYSDPLKPDHAPSALTTGGVTTTFTYDANGNMLSGLGGKIMEYDGENRPLSVTYLGKKTCYVYGVDGKRLKKVEGLSPATLCTALPPAANVTTYFGPVEVRNWLGAEQVLTYPQPSLKLTNSVATWLHFDHLGSVRAITDAAGAKVESAIYHPFGEQSEWLLPGTPSPETKGWIGERFDADAGLQYLNARYYDPALGLFLQPDWFEVTKAGVGTNRFSYGFNDPVNKIDPGGNQTNDETMGDEFDSPSCEESGGCDYRLQNWAGRQKQNLRAAWNDWPGAISGMLRGTVQDLAFGVENVPASPLLGPVGTMAGAAQGVLDTCKGSSGCSDYVYGEMTDAQQGGYLIGSVATGGVGIAKAAAKVVVKETAKTIVLGRFPAYTDLAKELQAEVFSIPTPTWNAMSATDQWAANQAFLDAHIAAGSSIRLASPVTEALPGTFFARELEYLAGRGYSLSADGLTMIQP